MENDNIDKMIYNYYRDMKIPTKFNNIANKIPKTSIYKKNKYIWKISTVCAIFLMICTVAFGKNIYLYILDSFAKIHEGIATAVKNDYYAYINMDYVESNNISIKVDYMLMDDFNLFIAFDVKSDIYTSKTSVKFKDMIITDENNNLIFCDDIDTYEKYCKKSGIEITTIPKSTYTDDGYGIEKIEQSEDKSKILYKLYSSQYPKSKELNIEIHTIELTTKEGTEEKNGAWKIKLNLPKEFYNREYTYYYVKDESNKEFNINIESVIVSNTQTVVKYSGKTKKYDNSMEGLEEQFDNLLNNEGTVFDEMWLENEKGEQFEISSINDGYGTKYSPDGSYEGELPFSLTKYDLTEKLYLIIEKNGERFRINLER